jgi:hypothetical protein
MGMMHLVDRMVMAPNSCMGCGRGNTPDQYGNIGPFVNLGIDYNWGDSGYLCDDCVGKAAVLFGWISPDTHTDLQRQIRDHQKRIHDLEAEIDMRRNRERVAMRKARAAA